MECMESNSLYMTCVQSEVCLHPLDLPAPDIMLVAVQMVQAVCTASAPPAPPLYRSRTPCTDPTPSAPPQALHHGPALSAPHTSVSNRPSRWTAAISFQS